MKHIIVCPKCSKALTVETGTSIEKHGEWVRKVISFEIVSAQCSCEFSEEELGQMAEPVIGFEYVSQVGFAMSDTGETVH